MVTIHKAIDGKYDKDTIIIETLFNYYILGQDDRLHWIDPCWARAYIWEKMERAETLVWNGEYEPFKLEDYDNNFGNEGTE